MLGRSSVYAAGPRCLVVLDPEIIPQVVEELRRKGYTPRVVTGP